MSSRRTWAVGSVLTLPTVHLCYCFTMHRATISSNYNALCPIGLCPLLFALLFATFLHHDFMTHVHQGDQGRLQRLCKPEDLHYLWQGVQVHPKPVHAHRREAREGGCSYSHQLPTFLPTRWVSCSRGMATPCPRRAGLADPLKLQLQEAARSWPALFVARPIQAPQDCCSITPPLTTSDRSGENLAMTAFLFCLQRELCRPGR